MRADDPRHGSLAGWTAHYTSGTMPVCQACTDGALRYEKQRELDLLAGKPRKVPSLGAQRRLQSLHAIGYSRPRLTLELGFAGSGWYSQLMNSETCYATTHDKIDALYRRLCMVIPEPSHSVACTKANAARQGFVPPLAWDDIDTDEHPRGALKDTA